MQMAERLTAPTKCRVASTQYNLKPAQPTSNATLFKFFLRHKLFTLSRSLSFSVFLSGIGLELLPMRSAFQCKS